MFNDLDLIRTILVQDFSSFPDHGAYANEKDDPLAAHLFSMNGGKWRNLRAKLSPTFTSGKMKSMFPIIDGISNIMLKVLDPFASRGEIVEMKDLVGRYGTDVIASVAYGIETNSLENPDSIFRTMGKKMFEPTLSNVLRNSIAFFLPDVARMIKLIQTDKELSKFFMAVVKDTVSYREKNDVQRNDFMQLLIQLKNKGVIDNVDDKESKGDPFTIETAAAQAFVFFIGGFETTSGVLQFTFYELAKNQRFQDRLRKEVVEQLAKSDGNLTYEGVFKMEYLGMVLDETLRKYPPAVILTREANVDYKIPDSDVTIEKGTMVFVAPSGIHHDTRYFPEPQVFDPERFTEEEKARRHHYAYLPFGEGPRFCIGQRFAQMQMRAATAALISKFKFEVCEKTPKDMVFDPKSIMTTPLGGMHLKITKL